jgi:hypothetical protein
VPLTKVSARTKRNIKQAPEFEYSSQLIENGIPWKSSPPTLTGPLTTYIKRHTVPEYLSAATGPTVPRCHPFMLVISPPTQRNKTRGALTLPPVPHGPRTVMRQSRKPLKRLSVAAHPRVPNDVFFDTESLAIAVGDTSDARA